MAERHIALGDRIIARQRELIGKLEHDGCDSSGAKALLSSFKELQALHIADRDRLMKELAEIAN